jgi:hypothetical protein
MRVRLAQLQALYLDSEQVARGQRHERAFAPPPSTRRLVVIFDSVP